MDARRDHGEYYPGGGTRQGAPSSTDGGANASGKVDRVDLGVIADDASASEMRTAIQRIQRAMRPAATAIAVLCGVWAAEARTNAWDKMRGGAAVVVEEEDEAAFAEIAAATNALAARIADATNGVVAALPPQQDLEPYATKAALAAATNAVMAAMPASANLEGYATKVWIGQQGFVTDAFLGTNFATKAWVNALGFVSQAALDAFEGTVEARVGVVENAVAGSTNGLASKAWIEEKGYVTASVTNGLAKRAWVTEQNDAAKAHADGKLEEAKAYSDANRESAKEYARNLAWAASEGMTRLVTEDGRTWQDATGTVWQVSDVWGWTGTAWTNNVSLPVTFYPDGSGTNWVSNIVGMRRLVTDGGEVPYIYLRDDNTPDLSQMADAMGKATDTNLTWEAISPLLGVMQGCSVQLYRAVVALETNAVRHVTYTDTQGGGGENASSAEEAQRLVTQDGNQWMDATGCVWRVLNDVVTRDGVVVDVQKPRKIIGPEGAYYDASDSLIAGDIYRWSVATGSGGTFTWYSETTSADVIEFHEYIYYVYDYLTNIVGRVALTNDVPSAISNATTRIDADLTVTETVTYDDWTPATSVTKDVPENGDLMYAAVMFYSTWQCDVLVWDDGYWRADHGDYMSGDTTNPDATELTFPDGTKTYRKRTIKTKLATTNDLPAKPSEPIVSQSQSIAWKPEGTGCVVTVPATGTLAADLTGWTECQSVTAIITLESGATVSPSIVLVGYGDWPVGEAFVAACVRVGQKVYVSPITVVR